MDAARAAPRDRGRERNRRTRRVSAAPLARPSTAPYTESGPTRQGEETLPGTGYESAVGEPGGGEARRVDGERRPTERTRETAFAGEESEAERADPRASSTQSETPEATEEDREKGGRTATGDWPSSRDAQATWRLQPCRLASSSPVLACTSSPSAEPASSPSFASPAVSSWLFNGNATRWDEQRAFRHTRNLSGNPVVFASPSDSDDERGSRPSQALSLSSLSPSERTAGASKSDGARLARAVSRPTAGPQPFEEFIQACCLPCCFPPRNPPPAAPQAASLSCCVCSSLVPSPPSASSRFPVSSPVASAGTRASPTSSLAPRGRKREPAGAQIEGKDRRTREEERASEACAETQAQPVGLTLLLRLIQFLTVKDFLNLSSVSVSLRRLLLSRTVSERCYFLFLLQDCLPSGFHSLHTCSTSRSSSTPHALSASSSAPQALSASSSAPQALSASSSLPASPSSSVSPGLPPLSPPFLALARASTAPLVFSYKGILQQRMRAQRAWLLPRPFLHEFFLSHPGPSLQDADAAADAGIEIQRSVSDEPSTPGRGKTCRSSARAWSASGRPLSPSVAETQLTAVAFSCSTPQSPCVPLVAATDSTNSCLLSKLGGSLQIPSSRSSFFHLLPALHSSDAPPSSGRPSDGGYSLAASWWTSSLEFLPSSPYLVAAQQHSGVCASLSDSLSAVHPCVSVYDLSSPLQHLASCTGEEGARHAQERAAREEEGYRTLPARKTVRLQAADRRNAKACACTSCWVVDTGLGDACGEATPPATGDSDASEETGRDGEKEGEQRARDHAVRSSCSHRMWALMSCGMAIALDLHRCEVVSRLSPGSPSSVSDSGAKARGCRVLPLSAASGVFTARGEEVAVVVESRGVFFCDSRLPNSLPFVLFSRAHAGREGGAAAQTLREDRPIAAACTDVVLASLFSSQCVRLWDLRCNPTPLQELHPPPFSSFHLRPSTLSASSSPTSSFSSSPSPGLYAGARRYFFFSPEEAATSAYRDVFSLSVPPRVPVFASCARSREAPQRELASGGRKETAPGDGQGAATERHIKREAVLRRHGLVLRRNVILSLHLNENRELQSSGGAERPSAVIHQWQSGHSRPWRSVACPPPAGFCGPDGRGTDDTPVSLFHFSPLSSHLFLLPRRSPTLRVLRLPERAAITSPWTNHTSPSWPLNL